ncbi:MAG: hypothetical protein KF824_05265 [Fimbriimonadaceae bacterium]|nr:MAG: hypothetical protein KF824_05265 [Fimbriimonadaceae bacterium]
MADIPELINILREARSYLQKGEGDYSWSSWEDDRAALAEIDEIIRQLLLGDPPPTVLNVLLAPTGPMQEVSLSSGWGNEFVKLSDRFDQAMAANPCSCLEQHQSSLMVESHLGMDKSSGEVSVLKCPQCGQLWLRYFYENEAVTASGRWYECPISAYEKKMVTVDSAVDLMNSKPWFYVGGSYFDGLISKSKPPIRFG